MTSRDERFSKEMVNEMDEHTTDIAGPISDADEGWEWAHVELMGHRAHWGRCREQERFGLKMLRIDVPIDGAPEIKGWESHFYSGTALYGYQPTTMEAVLKANKPYVSAYLSHPRSYEPEPDNDKNNAGSEPLHDAAHADVEAELPFDPPPSAIVTEIQAKPDNWEIPF